MDTSPDDTAWDHDDDDRTPPVAVDMRGVLHRYGHDIDVYVSKVERERKLIWVRVSDPYSYGYGTTPEIFRWISGKWTHVNNPNIKLNLDTNQRKYR